MAEEGVQLSRRARRALQTAEGGSGTPRRSESAGSSAFGGADNASTATYGGTPRRERRAELAESMVREESSMVSAETREERKKRRRRSSQAAELATETSGAAPSEGGAPSGVQLPPLHLPPHEEKGEDDEELRRALRGGRNYMSDDRVVPKPKMTRVPRWVRLWRELKVMTSYTFNPTVNATQSVRESLEFDLRCARILLAEVRSRGDGGWFERSAVEVEQSPPPPLTPETAPAPAPPGAAPPQVPSQEENPGGDEEAALLPRDDERAAQNALAEGEQNPQPYWWEQPGTAESALAELCQLLEDKLYTLQSKAPLGFDDLCGVDGTATYTLPDASKMARKTTLQRFMTEDLFQQMQGTGDGAAGQQSKAEAFMHDANRMPVVRNEFLMTGEGNKVDITTLKDPATVGDAMKQAQEGSASEELQRVITLNVNFVRFRDHQMHTREHSYASALLDAYERYRLLNSNLSPDGLRSRKYYKDQIDSLHDSFDHLADSAQQFAEELSRLEALHQTAAEAERAYIREMIESWKDVVAVREAERVARTAISLQLRRHLDPQEEIVTDYEGQDELLFVPVIKGLEGYTSAFFAQPLVPLPEGAPPPPDPTSSSGVPQFVVKAYVKTRSGLPAQLIGSTERRPLDSTYTARFNETFEVHTNTDPVELSVAVVDEQNVVLATLHLSPSLSEFADLMLFSTGETFDRNGTNRESCGVVSLSTNWTTASGMTIENIQHLFMSGEADPMDPRNEHLVSVLRRFYGDEGESTGGAAKGGRGRSSRKGSSVPTDGKPKSCIPVKEELTDLRQRTIRWRWELKSGERLPKTDGDLALMDHAVPADSYNTKKLLRRLERGAQEQINTQRSSKALAEWQAKIRKNKMRRRAQAPDDHELLAKYITVPPVPTFKRFISNIVAFFAPRSKLAPTREERPENDEIDRGKLAEQKGNSQLVVHVMKANNLPIREDGSPLEPFVEVSFVHETGITRVESGNNPSWFETLFVDFQPLDFDEETLSLIDDDIIVSFYDQVRVSLPYLHQSEGAPAAHMTHYRTERRLIGLVKLPFYTLFQSPEASVEGLYSISIPRWVMGYRFAEGEALEPSVNLYFSLSPPLRKKEEPPANIKDTMVIVSNLPVSRPLYVLNQAAGYWQIKAEGMIAKVAAQNPLAGRREVQAFVPNKMGDPILICRYILAGGCAPPPGLTTVQQVVHFVSLIPFVVDIMAWEEDDTVGAEDHKDVWRTNAEYLSMVEGDYEEMALLVLHYIRYVEPQSHCYLVLGEGDVYKQATFVLYGSQVDGKIDWKLIDPRIGAFYSIGNPRCGLSEVSCVVSHNQVWANLQLSGSPYRMVWNMLDSRDWLPMFNDTHSEYLPYLDSVQRESLTYQATVPDEDIGLADNIKRRVKKQLKVWRHGKSPNFQERAGTILKEILMEMESERFHSANSRLEHVNRVHEQALEEFAVDSVPVGHPVNVAFRGEKDSEFDELMTLLQEAVVHEVGTDAVRFALGVYVKGYTNSIKSIWVYLVALVPKDSVRQRSEIL